LEALKAGKDSVVAGSVKNKLQAGASNVVPDSVGARMQAGQTKPGSGSD
jgi:hypothetical protein